MPADPIATSFLAVTLLLTSGCGMTCLEEVMSAEIAYFAALESATSWSASESELVLSDSSGQELLRYQSATA